MSEDAKPAVSSTVENVVLLPCPFCGGQAHFEWYKKGLHTDKYDGTCGIRCMVCRAVIPSNRTAVNAVKAWNRRIDTGIRWAAEGLLEALGKGNPGETKFMMDNMVDVLKAHEQNSPTCVSGKETAGK